MKKGQIFLNRVLALLVVILVTVGHFDSYAFAQDVSRLTYEAHSQNIGWQSEVSEGTISGTTGRSLRLEALKIQLLDELQAKGDIEYRVHVKDKGWLPWVKNGAQAGTTGESRCVEAVEIRLTGELSTLFDIEYQVHVKDIGWLSWVKNGAQAGTTGESRRAEAVKIRLVEKASSPSTDEENPEDPEVPEEPNTPPSTPEVIKYTVTFRANAKGVENIPVTQQIKSGAKASEPVSPTLVGYDFKGWTKTRNGEDYWDFAKDTVTQETILYAKWGLTPLTVTDVDGFGGSAGETDAGDTVALAGSNWRILKKIAGEEGVKDKYLIIKEQALTQEETGDTDTSFAVIPFHNQDNGTDDEKYKYFSIENDDGYTRSNLKAVIDSYYDSYIAPNYSDYVLNVNVPNPKFTDLAKGEDNSVTWSVPTNFAQWNGWNEYYEFWKENRWPTTYDTGSQQAFALSSSDIIYYNLNDDDYNSNLLNFTGSNVNYFWLRSAGYDSDYAGSVDSGNFDLGSDVNDRLPVRPALWISLD